MTKAQAYNVLGVNTYSSLFDIEKAYRDRLSLLLPQAQYGNTLAVRDRTQQQMAELKDALECLRIHHTQIPVSTTASPQGFTQAQAIPNSQHNTTARKARMNTLSILPIKNRPLAVSFIIAVITMLLVALLSIGASGGFRTKESASLRVLSVPWCDVEIDGKSIGPSGQAEPFVVTDGTHRVTLSRGKRSFSEKLLLEPGEQVCLKVQFEKEQTNVSRNKQNTK